MWTCGESFSEWCGDYHITDLSVMNPRSESASRPWFAQSGLANRGGDHHRASSIRLIFGLSKDLQSSKEMGRTPPTAELLGPAVCAPLLWAILPTSLTLRGPLPYMNGSIVLERMPMSATKLLQYKEILLRTYGWKVRKVNISRSKGCHRTLPGNRILAEAR